MVRGIVKKDDLVFFVPETISRSKITMPVVRNEKHSSLWTGNVDVSRAEMLPIVPSPERYFYSSNLELSFRKGD